MKKIKIYTDVFRCLGTKDLETYVKNLLKNYKTYLKRLKAEYDFIISNITSMEYKLTELYTNIICLGNEMEILKENLNTEYIYKKKEKAYNKTFNELCEFYNKIKHIYEIEEEMQEDK